MQIVVADTHAILWFLAGSKRLTPAATQALQSAERILVPTISLVEITYLVEKGRLDPAVLPRLFGELDNTTTTLEPVPLDLRVALALADVPRSDVPDMPDRVIAATALFFQVPLISRDRKIRHSGLTTIW
jgi:PIN domain nuclease of toxin-antitoxin system